MLLPLAPRCRSGCSGELFVSVVAYQPGRPNSNDDLRRDLASALTDFSLTATTGWLCAEPVAGAR